jgi:hypothetical protein
MAYCSTPKAEVTCSSETSVDILRTMTGYIPEGRDSQCREIFKAVNGVSHSECDTPICIIGADV